MRYIVLILFFISIVQGENIKHHYLFFTGTIILQNNTLINKEIEKIRSDKKLDNPTYSIGGEYLYQARKSRFGIGGNYNFGDKVDTTLQRIDDGARVHSGDISINSYEVYLLFEKNFIYRKYIFPFGWYLAPKFKQLRRIQNANEQEIEYRRNQYGFGLGLFYYLKIYKFINLRFRIGYDLLGLDGSGPNFTIALNTVF